MTSFSLAVRELHDNGYQLALDDFTLDSAGTGL